MSGWLLIRDDLFYCRHHHDHQDRQQATEINHCHIIPPPTVAAKTAHRHQNCRYWECTVLQPETKEGHCRLGWSLATGSLQGPVGYDKSSYAYRDIAGSKARNDELTAVSSSFVPSSVRSFSGLIFAHEAMAKVEVGSPACWRLL